MLSDFDTKNLPQEWRFCKISANKNPYEKNWPDIPYKIDEIKLTDKCKAVGVLCGPASGGLICLDIDGPAAEKKLSELGTIPKSVSWTSGKPHRRQIAFWAYEEDWEHLHTAHLLKGVPDQELVCRWKGQQSVVIGHHPDTDGYRWINSPEHYEVAIAPNWLTQLMWREPKELPASDDVLDAFLAGDHDLAVSLMKQLPTNPYAEDYHYWIKVGAAMHAVSINTGQDLFEEWVEWSTKADNCCSREEYEAKWESFRRSPGDSDAAGLGSLIYLVDEAKVELKPPKSEPIVKLNVSWAELPNWYYVANENKYAHRDCPTEMLAPLNFNTRFKKVSIPKASSKVKNSVDCINWNPGEPMIYIDQGREVLNIHRPYPMGKPGPVDLFRKLVEYCYPKEAEVLYDFMAFTIKHPGEKINFAPYMVGAQGIGKNFIWEPLKRALKGEFHCIHNDNRSAQYNDYLLGRKLVIIDEPMNLGGSRFAIANELKGLIASTGEDDRLHINGKYRAYVEQVHLTNFAILTNFSDAIKIKGERRFYPCFSDSDPLPGEFYTEFAQWLESGGTAAVIHWLRQRDLSKFNAKIAPAPTDSLDSIVQDSMTELSECIQDFVEKHKAVNFAQCRELTKALIKGNGADFITRNVISELGYVYKAGRKYVKKVKYQGKTINFRMVYLPSMDADEAFECVKAYLRENDGVLPTPDIPTNIF